jgi:hypothetical protein
MRKGTRGDAHSRVAIWVVVACLAAGGLLAWYVSERASGLDAADTSQAGSLSEGESVGAVQGASRNPQGRGDDGEGASGALDAASETRLGASSSQSLETRSDGPGERDEGNVGPVSRDALETQDRTEETRAAARQGAAAAARATVAFARALSEATTKETLETALRAQGVASTETSRGAGATGTRVKAALAPVATEVRGLLEGEVVWEGHAGGIVAADTGQGAAADPSRLALEHARLVYDPAFTDAAALRVSISGGLPPGEWVEAPGPTPAVTLWRNESAGLLISVKSFARSDEKPWDGFPPEGIVVSVQRAHE